MRLLYINTLYSPDIGGGAEITLHTIASGMVRRGHHVTAVATWSGNHVSESIVDGVHVIRLPSRNIYWQFGGERQPQWKRLLWHVFDSYNAGAARAIAKVVQGCRPDVVSCHNLQGFSAAVWEHLYALAVPHIQVLHDYYAICPKVTMFRGNKNCEMACDSCKIFRLPHRKSSSGVSAVVGVSQFVLEAHLKAGLFRGAHIKQVIYNARKLPTVPPKVNNECFTVGFIGGLTPVKGIYDLLESFKRVSAARKMPLKLLIAGTGKAEFTALLQQSAQGFNVEFIGHVNPEDFFPRLDVAVVPSVWNEPLGGVVIEALHYGVATIGARRGGIPEMIQHEYSGLLYDPADSMALDAALLRLLDEPILMARLQENAASSIATFLDVERMIDQYESLSSMMLAASSNA